VTAEDFMLTFSASSSSISFVGANAEDDAFSEGQTWKYVIETLPGTGTIKKDGADVEVNGFCGVTDCTFNLTPNECSSTNQETLFTYQAQVDQNGSTPSETFRV